MIKLKHIYNEIRIVSGTRNWEEKYQECWEDAEDEIGEYDTWEEDGIEQSELINEDAVGSLADEFFEERFGFKYSDDLIKEIKLINPNNITHEFIIKFFEENDGIKIRRDIANFLGIYDSVHILYYDEVVAAIKSLSNSELIKLYLIIQKYKIKNLDEIRIIGNQTKQKFDSFKVGDKVKYTSLKGKDYIHTIIKMKIKDNWGTIFFNNSGFGMTIPFFKPITYNSKFNSMVKING